MAGDPDVGSDGGRQPRPSWRPRRSYVVLVLLLVVSASYVGVNGYYGSKVQAELRRLRAEGKPLAAADLLLPRVPEEENAAHLYLQAADIAEPRETAGATGADGSRPYHMLNWRKPEDLPLLAEHIAELEPAIELVRNATPRPHCRFYVDWGDLWAVDLSHLARMRAVARLMNHAAVAAAYEGNQPEALERLGMGFIATRHLSEEPSTIGILVGCAIDAIMLDVSEYVMRAGPLPEPEARKLAEELLSVDYADWLQEGTLTRRATGLAVFKCGRRGGVGIAVAGPAGPSREERLLWRVYGQLIPAWLYADELRFLDMLEEEERLAGIPIRARSTGPVLLSSRPPIEHPRWARATRLLSSPVDRAALKAEIGAARRGLFATALGLEVHRQRTGAYPNRLDALAATGWPMTEDVFSGQGFVYQRQGDSFLLYSVGPDLQDDGGRPPSRLPLLTTEANLDLVWGTGTDG